ncbi:MAG TPA: exodeoxyribonuclease VII small subunit [Candidatus Barnesiella excrementipullorum]|jgi:exodeoxyribonuclease VII small subunit|uniref:Exodeoxyribonuclease VII small subunit n=1 Tax=Candidatus Barnesiella excrementipullorum TaxID=2838479 RepID=A0A9D1VPU2_9BACT|nr:exodeoxyribonuclease VII small subunit [Candidatus Barnesiella excrementipullorum]
MTAETENTSSDNLSYTQAIAELEQLVARLQNPQCEIDKLREYTARALQLIQYCKTKLSETDNDLKKLLEELSQDNL